MKRDSVGEIVFTAVFQFPRDFPDRKIATKQMALRNGGKWQLYFDSEDVFFFPAVRAAERIAERVAVSFA